MHRRTSKELPGHRRARCSVPKAVCEGAAPQIGSDRADQPSGSGLVAASARLIPVARRLRVFFLLAAAVVFASGAGAQQPPPARSSAGTAEVAVLELGLDSETLSAAGLNSLDCEDMLKRLASSPETISALRTARLSLASAHAALESAQTSVAAGAPGAASKMARSQRDLADATSLIAAVHINLRELAFDGVPASSELAIENILSAKQRRVPVAFKVVARSDAEWANIEDALRREARAIRMGEPLDSAKRALLAAIRSDPAVVAATEGLSLNRSSIESVLARE